MWPGPNAWSNQHHHDREDQREARRPLRRLPKDPRGVVYRTALAGPRRWPGPTNRGEPILHPMFTLTKALQAANAGRAGRISPALCWTT